MAASLMNLLDDLETRLERTQAELHALREENQRLKQQLTQPHAQEQGVPSPIPATVTEAYSEEAVYQEATDSAEAEQETPQIGAQEADRPEEQEAFEPSVAAFEPNVTESLVRDRASESISDSYETANNLAESSQTAAQSVV